MSDMPVSFSVTFLLLGCCGLTFGVERMGFGRGAFAS